MIDEATSAETPVTLDRAASCSAGTGVEFCWRERRRPTGSFGLPNSPPSFVARQRSSMRKIDVSAPRFALAGSLQKAMHSRWCLRRRGGRGGGGGVRWRQGWEAAGENTHHSRRPIAVHAAHTASFLHPEHAPLSARRTTTRTPTAGAEASPPRAATTCRGRGAVRCRRKWAPFARPNRAKIARRIARRNIARRIACRNIARGAPPPVASSPPRRGRRRRACPRPTRGGRRA